MPSRFFAALLLLGGLTGCGLDFFAPDAQALLDDSNPGVDSRNNPDDSRPGGDDSSSGDDSQPQGNGPTIEYYDPVYGPASGGTTVTFIGGPFDDSSTVTFGEVPATITDRSQSTLSARSPSGADGPVDVTITNSDGRTVLTEGFFYFTDGAGLAGTFGELWWIEFQGQYWNPSPPDSYGGARWALIEAMSWNYWDFFAPSVDTCRSEYDYPGEILVYDLEASTTTLRSGSASINLQWDASALQWSNTADLTSSQYVQNATYDLVALNDGLLPGFQVTPLATTPRAFSVTGPSQLVHNGQYLELISRNQMNFTWSSSDAHAIVLQLGITNAAGDGFQEVVTCWARNDGSFSVPASAFNSWAADRYLYAYVGSVVQSGGTLPTNGAESRVAGVFWKVHVGYTN